MFNDNCNFPGNLIHKNYSLHIFFTILLLVFYLASIHLSLADNILAALLGSFCAGISLTYGFSIAHECAHNNWLKSKTANHIIGQISILPTMIAYENFKRRHMLHHFKTHDIDKDDVWLPTEIIVKNENGFTAWLDYLARYHLHFLGPLIQALCNYRIKENRLVKTNDKVIISTYISILFAMLTLGLAILSFRYFIFSVLFPLLIFHQIFGLIGVFQHTSLKNPNSPPWYRKVKNSAAHQFNVTLDSPLPAFVEYLVAWSNYHVSHHLDARIPFYKNKDAHNYLLANHKNQLQINDVNIDSIHNYIRHGNMPKSFNFSANRGSII